LKKYILFFVAIIAVTAAEAQSGYNYYPFGVGAEASLMRGYTNVPRQYEHPGVNLNLIYNYNPYLPIAAEIQDGQLSGGGLTTNLDRYGRKFDNHFVAVVFHADLQLGAAIDYSDSWVLNIVKNFYFGTGFGFIKSSNVVQRTNVLPQDGSTDYVFPGKDHTLDLMIPLRGGYEFKIWDSYNEPMMAVDLGYAHYIAFGEGIDGYDDPPSKFKNNAINQYRQFTLGIKFFFGNTLAYNKLIRNFRY
jgi:hypothetical protein